MGIYLLSDVSQIQILAYFGAGLYVFSGMVFGGLPVFEFRKKGGVKNSARGAVAQAMEDSSPILGLMNGPPLSQLGHNRFDITGLFDNARACQQ